ncbi:iron ABC transporter permease [Acidovorax sp. Be4]|uniref:Iron ABC transporter permease n=1 Tax=Acidovorax bellezanensis TaxID=2976702 RepID=A0ABT2PKI1_9BURK|nr:iron ABC transporter permease [Acidovorax sp. Be4]MCT9810738.1 iron ABC transporter permease [Acidovorax sp. Be4]
MTRVQVAPRPWLLNLGLLAALLVLACISLGIGSVRIGVADWWHAVFAQGGGSDLALRHQAIVQEIRLPRVLLAVLVGMSLGVSGAALQGLLRNPLAEPGILGVSSSAGLGAVVCIYFGLWHWNAWLLPTVAMGSAAAATSVLYRIARNGASNLTLILAGVAMSALTAALTALAINLAPTPTDMQDIVLWLMGSLADRSFDEVRLSLPFIVLGLALLAMSGRHLDALTLGEDEAASMGVNLARLRAQIIAGTALCVGASVAVTGSIGFIGLVVPHVFRGLVGYRPSRLILPSALGGAVLLLAADIALRLLSGRVELMLGVVTALIGAPFFFYLVLRERWRTR